MTVTNEVVYQNVIAVALDIDVPTGKKSAIASDLRLQDVPPSTLMSLGQKQTFDPALVVPLNSARKEAERQLLKAGVRFGGLILVPTAKSASALEEVRRIKAEFEGCAQALFAQYEPSVAKWAESAPQEWRHALIGAADTLDDIKRKTKFQFQVLRLSGVDGEASNQDVGESLVGQLYHEIAVDAARTWRESLANKTDATHNIRRPFARFREKLSGLAFLNPSIAVLIQKIDEVMASLPTKGEKIEGPSLVAIQGLCLILSEEGKIREFCDAAANGNAPMSLPLFSAPTQAVSGPVVAVQSPVVPPVQAPAAAAPLNPAATPAPAVSTVEAEVLAPAPVVSVPPPVQSPAKVDRRAMANNTFML